MAHPRTLGFAREPQNTLPRTRVTETARLRRAFAGRLQDPESLPRQTQLDERRRKRLRRRAMTQRMGALGLDPLAMRGDETLDVARPRTWRDHHSDAGVGIHA